MSSLALDLARAFDPAALADAVGMETPQDWQLQVLRSRDKRMLLNCARGSGKSTVVALLAAHRILYWPGSLVLIISPSQRQSGEVFKKVLKHYKDLSRPVPAEAETQLTLTLENGSRILALPGGEGTIRGYHADLILVDEASRVSDETYGSITPMLAVTGGQLVALSTPNGRRGWWWDEWRGHESWLRLEVPYTDCSHYADGYVEQERRRMGSYFFDQEYLCRFQEGATSAFRIDDCEALIDPEFEEWTWLRVNSVR